MKILIASDFYVPIVNGVVVSICNLIRGLRDAGHEVRVLTLSNTTRSHINGDVYYAASFSAAKVYPNARIKLLRSKKIIQEIVAWAPDVIHTQCEFSTFSIARKISKRCGAPIVHTYHTSYEDYTHYFCPSKKLGKFIAKSLSRKFLNKTSEVIAPTPKVEEMLASYGIKVPVKTIPTGLDLDQFERGASEAKIRKIREELGIADDKKIILTVGRLAKEKNIEELLSFFKRADREDIVFVVVGDGPHREKLEKAAASLCPDGKVIFTGMVPPEDVAAYYRLGDVFISASQSETQGLTYIEAMASGVPVLCRKDPCLDGLVENGVNGFQYETEEEFRQMLEDLLNDPELRHRIGNAASETAHERFSITGFARSVMKVYTSAPKKNKK